MNRLPPPGSGGGVGGVDPSALLRQQQQPPPQQQQDEDSYSYDEEEDAEEDEVPWVVWFCGLKGNEFFCEVDEEYIRDDFNLTGLSLMVPFFDNAVEMILDLDSPQDERLTEEQQRLVDSSAETLYGLIHARFILTPRGLKLMEEKYRSATFGRCPRVTCGGHPVLPVGQSDVVRESSVKLYCPKCRELYFPRSTRHKALDGAFWGTSFPHLLLITLYDGPPPIENHVNAYVPRIFGFRVRDPRTITIGGSGDNNNNNNNANTSASAATAMSQQQPVVANNNASQQHADPMSMSSSQKQKQPGVSTGSNASVGSGGGIRGSSPPATTKQSTTTSTSTSPPKAASSSPSGINKSPFLNK